MICNRIDYLGLKCQGIGTGCAMTEKRLRYANPIQEPYSPPVFYGLDLSTQADETVIVLSRARYIKLCSDEREIQRREGLVEGYDGDIILRTTKGAWKDAEHAIKKISRT